MTADAAGQLAALAGLRAAGILDDAAAPRVVSWKELVAASACYTKNRLYSREYSMEYSIFQNMKLLTTLYIPKEILE